MNTKGKAVPKQLSWEHCLCNDCGLVCHKVSEHLILDCDASSSSLLLQYLLGLEGCSFFVTFFALGFARNGVATSSLHCWINSMVDKPPTKMERELCEVLSIAGAIDDEEGGGDPCWIRHSPTCWYLASCHREVKTRIPWKVGSNLLLLH